jgi:hydroxyacylglutathione hydrolase
MSYAIADLTTGEEPVMVFSGDTLFVGDVGRVDLYGPKEAKRLAENLYDSIFNRILPLGDGVILYPAHSAGSICGGTISEREESTLGLERVQSAILQNRKKDFIRIKAAEHHERPPYFRKMEKYNLEGPPLLRHLPDPDHLAPKEFLKRMGRGALVVDTRKPSAFGGAHIKGSYSIWLEGLPSQAGWVLSYGTPILLVLEDDVYLDEAVRYLIRLGYDGIDGYLCGVEAWYNEALNTEHLGLLTIQELRARREDEDRIGVLDVRGDDEWEDGHIEGAMHIPLGHLKERLKEVPRNLPIAVVCKVGNRASLGASILRREGYKEVYNVLGSMTAWKKAMYPVVE